MFLNIIKENNSFFLHTCSVFLINTFYKFRKTFNFYKNIFSLLFWKNIVYKNNNFQVRLSLWILEFQLLKKNVPRIHTNNITITWFERVAWFFDSQLNNLCSLLSALGFAKGCSNGCQKSMSPNTNHVITIITVSFSLGHQTTPPPLRPQKQIGNRFQIFFKHIMHHKNTHFPFWPSSLRLQLIIGTTVALPPYQNQNLQPFSVDIATLQWLLHYKYYIMVSLIDVISRLKWTMTMVCGLLDWVDNECWRPLK